MFFQGSFVFFVCLVFFVVVFVCVCPDLVKITKELNQFFINYL